MILSIRHKQTLVKVSSLCALLLAVTASVAQAKPTPQQGAQQTGRIYERAKAQLPGDWYTIYRIVDRIARANGLDKTPWRLSLQPQYEINAFATEVNLIAVYRGLLDQLEGDSSAIACVVAHEMGHHQKRHIAVSEKQEVEIKAKLREDIATAVDREQSTAKRDAETSGLLGGLLANLGTLGQVGGAIVNNGQRKRSQEAQKRIEQIYQQKTAELDFNIKEASRKHEFEADEAGYLYAARAGFDPEGCLRVMTVLGRNPRAEMDSSHPAIPRRIEAIQALMKQYPAAKLTAEGKVNMSRTQPLTYDLSRDGASLRVNSQFGGSSGADIDRLFGK